MKRIDIENGRWSHKEHLFYTKEEIEEWYKGVVYDKIYKRLQNINDLSVCEKASVTSITKRLEDILLASPEKLEVYRRYYDFLKRRLSCDKAYFEKQKDKDGKKRKPSKYSVFRDKLLSAFNYDGFRSNVLRELGNKLNVKTCPYCNLHYTLCIEDFNDEEIAEMMAKFQFDHFIDKAEYPILSMSFYNLIPSCPTCNHGKSQLPLSLDFHPYQSDICYTFKFEVKDPTKLFVGSEQTDEEIELVKIGNVEIDNYNKVFHIKKLYMRHKDVMQDIFARAYEQIYYGNPDNFGFVGKPDLRKRIQLGFFPDEKDINLRPMTKFQQDLWEQAQGDYDIKWG